MHYFVPSQVQLRLPVFHLGATSCFGLHLRTSKENSDSSLLTLVDEFKQCVFLGVEPSRKAARHPLVGDLT